ncbi:unnamed protein product [Porites lobata]|uniref:Uncharacterized protein n=1 Tax=Porites lobata TaxID=104759 RepID=A0ABN8QVU5_9CNID|nr:unnamed protein product [Porites lobata]
MARLAPKPVCDNTGSVRYLPCILNCIEKGWLPRLRLGESNDSLKPTTNHAPKECLG